jgi:hypothetical protein
MGSASEAPSPGLRPPSPKWRGKVKDAGSRGTGNPFGMLQDGWGSLEGLYMMTTVVRNRRSQTADS